MKWGSNSYRGGSSYLKSCELPMRSLSILLHKPFTLKYRVLEVSVSRKTNKFLKFFQSTNFVLLIKQHARNLAHLGFINKKKYRAISIFTSNSTSPLFWRMFMTNRGYKPQKNKKSGEETTVYLLCKMSDTSNNNKDSKTACHFMLDELIP